MIYILYTEKFSFVNSQNHLLTGKAHKSSTAGEERSAEQRPGELQEHCEQHQRHAQQADQLDPEERGPDDQVGQEITEDQVMIRAAQGQERAGGGDHRLGGEDLQDLCSQVGTGAVGTYNFSNMMKYVRTSSFVTMIV